MRRRRGRGPARRPHEARPPLTALVALGLALAAALGGACSGEGARGAAAPSAGTAAAAATTATATPGTAAATSTASAPTAASASSAVPAASAAASGSAAPAAPPTAAEVLARLAREAEALRPLVEAPWVEEWAAGVARLPPVAERVLHHDADKTHWYTAAQAAALPEAERATLKERRGGTELFYETRYGTPLAYARALDLAAAHGLTGVSGRRVVDLGFGTVGHLRLLALAGAAAVGVDVDPFLRALYAEPGDQGPFPAGGPGSVTLLFGNFPTDRAVVQGVGTGNALVLSKNVLKRGYVHPEQPVPPGQRVDLGVSDLAFVRALRRTLARGGLVVVHNLCPAPNAPGRPYRTWADCRSAFDRGTWEAGGFAVLAFDQDDTAVVRAFGRAFGWDTQVKLEEDLFATATVLRAR